MTFTATAAAIEVAAVVLPTLTNAEWDEMLAALVGAVDPQAEPEHEAFEPERWDEEDAYWREEEAAYRENEAYLTHLWNQR